MTRHLCKEEGARAFLRPPMGNHAFYSREVLSAAKGAIMKAWATGANNSLKRDVALTLLADPELRLRVCHIEEILRARQLASRPQANGFTSAGGMAGAAQAGKDLHLQTALADPSFAALFQLDSSINEPEWGMQVLWLNMSQLQKELGLPLTPPPPVPPAATQQGSFVPIAAAPAAATPSAASPPPLCPVTVPEPALLTAFEAAFPNHPTDEEDYLAIAACYCLATRRDPRSLLPPLSLHLTDLTAHLRSYAAADARLGAVLQRVAVAPASHGGLPPATLAARLADLLAAAPGTGTRLVFRQSESLSRKGERVVSLALEQLTRLSGGGATGGRARGAEGVSRAHLGSGGSPPYELWQRSCAFVFNGGDSAAGDRLPVFLFEYEAPSDVRDDMAAPLAAQRDQYDTAVVDSPSGRSLATGSSSSPSSAAAVGGGGDLRTAANTSPQHVPQPLQLPQATSLPYSWSDHARDVLTAAAEPLPQLPSMASEPVTFRTSGDKVRLGFPKALPSASEGGSAAVAAAAAIADLMPGLGPGATWQSGNGKPSTAVDGSSPSHSFNNSLRLSVYDGSSSNSNNRINQINGVAATLFQQTIASAASSQSAPDGGGPPSMALAAAAAAAAPLGTSPGGPTGELHVPQAIADVWANSGATAAAAAAAAAAAGGLAIRRSSVAAPSANGGGLPADGSLNSMLAISPTREGSYFWERMAARTSGQLVNPLLGRTIAAGNGAAATDFGALGLAGFGLGYSSAGTTGLMAGGGATQLVVGSAPPVFVPPLLNGSGAAVAAAAGGLGGLNGAGGIGGIGSGAALLDYASWQSSSPELSSSVGGRSAPADTALAVESWMLACGARPPVGCGGAAAAGGRGAGQHAAATVAAAAAGADGRAGVASRGGGGCGCGGGSEASPSTVSEESEEAASVVGGLDLDPMALTIEALIGLEPSRQLDAAGVPRRAAMTGPAGPPNAASKGLIAAAAAPKGGDAVASTSTAASGAVTSPPCKSFGSVSASSVNVNTVSSGGGAAAAVADGSSRHSSLDSCEVLNGDTAAGAVLTSWSAAAARGPPLQSPSAHQSTAAAATAAAGMHLAPGGRVGGPQLQHGLLQQPGTAATVMTAQGLAATMAAMGAVAAAAAAGGAAGNLAVSRSASLGQGGGGGLLGMSGLPPPAGGSTAAPPTRDVLGGKALHPRLTQRVREEICQLVRTVPGLKAEDFDDGVLHQLTLKKSEDEAVGALRTLAVENLSGIQHMAAYINHIIKNYHHLTRPAQGGGPAGAASLPSATVRANSTPVSSKAILQKLPLRVYRRLEELIAKCSYMEWKHFDAGVVKVMAQLAEIGEEDVFEELELLKSTDLSNVEYMPAYLNKRLNNRLWSRRKMLTAAAVGAGGP